MIYWTGHLICILMLDQELIRQWIKNKDLFLNSLVGGNLLASFASMHSVLADYGICLPPSVLSSMDDWFRILSPLHLLPSFLHCQFFQVHRQSSLAIWVITDGMRAGAALSVAPSLFSQHAKNRPKLYIFFFFLIIFLFVSSEKLYLLVIFWYTCFAPL